MDWIVSNKILTNADRPFRALYHFAVSKEAFDCEVNV